MLTPQQIKEIEEKFDDGFREQLSVVEADMIKSFIITTINNILAERDKEIVDWAWSKKDKLIMKWDNDKAKSGVYDAIIYGWDDYPSNRLNIK